MDCSPPVSSVHGLLQARMLEWVATPSSRGSSRPRDRTCCLLHWQMSSLPLAPPEKTTATQQPKTPHWISMNGKYLWAPASSLSLVLPSGTRFLTVFLQSQWELSATVPHSFFSPHISNYLCPHSPIIQNVNLFSFSQK